MLGYDLRLIASKSALSAILAVGAIPAVSLWAEDDPDEDEAGGGFTEELLIGESPFPQEAGEYQITLCGSFLDGEEAETSGLSIEVEYGISDRFQIGFEAPYKFLSPDDPHEHSEDGIGDIAFGALYSFYQDDRWTASIAAEIALDTGDEDKHLGEGAIASEVALLFAYSAESWEAYFSLGGEFVEGGEFGFAYSAGLATPLGPEGWLSIIEIAGETGIEDEDELTIAPSLSVKLPHHWEFIFGVPIGLTDDTEDWGTIAKLSVEF